MKDIVGIAGAGAVLAALLSLRPIQSFTLPSLKGRATVSSLNPSSSHFKYASIEPQLFSTLSDKESKNKSGDKQSKASFDPSDEFTGAAPSKILGKPIPYSDLAIGVLKETYPGENRVSIAPESAKMLVDAGFNVIVESGGMLNVIVIFPVF